MDPALYSRTYQAGGQRPQAHELHGLIDYFSLVVKPELGLRGREAHWRHLTSTRAIRVNDPEGRLSVA
jgi:hypothetical protein